MNRMSYKEALDRLKKLEKLQRKYKLKRQNLSKIYGNTFVSNITYNINKRVIEINYLLSIIHAHKLSRKLYAEVKFLKEQYGV